MKHLLAVWVLVMAVVACQEEKARPGSASGPAPAKVASVVTGPGVKAAAKEMLTHYLLLAEALVNYDSVQANNASMALAAASDSVDLSGTPDSAVMRTIQDQAGTIHSEALALVEEKDLTEKRREFSMITENLYPFLQAIQYSDQKLYYQMCPMAFNDSETAFWISDRPEIVNPYLGNKHPKYASGMLHCGETKDSLHFAK